MIKDWNSRHYAKESSLFYTENGEDNELFLLRKGHRAIDLAADFVGQDER